MDDSSMAMMCSMNMLWNVQIVNTCVVFRGWRIGSTGTFVWSCFALASMSLFYEYLRFLQRRFDQRIAASLAKQREAASHGHDSTANIVEQGLPSSPMAKWFRLNTPTEVVVPFVPRLIRAGLYGVSVFLSSFLMLVLMTYNGYIILAIVIGAAIGHAVFGSTINIDGTIGPGDKAMSCH